MNFFLKIIIISIGSIVSMQGQVDNSERKITINFDGISQKEPPRLENVQPADYKIKNKDFKVDLIELNLPDKLSLLSPSAKNGFQHKSNLDLEYFGREKPKHIALNKENPIKRYPSQNEKILNYIKEGGYVKHFPDIDLGTFETTSDKVYIKFRDNGQVVDGDAIRIIVNDRIVVNEIILTRFIETYVVNLVDGFNRVEIETVSEGTIKPNTMHLIIQDGNQVLFRNKNYTLSTGSSSNIVILKI